MQSSWQSIARCTRHTQTRCFSNSSSLRIVPRTNALSLLPEDAPPPPPYPYSKNRWYKQADRGLYGGAAIQFGNNVSEDNETKTRRTWQPNVHHKWIYSQSLNLMVRLKLSTRVLKTIDKVGGLDKYLIGKSPARIKELGEEGWKLRWAILQTPQMRKRAKVDPSIRQLTRDPVPQANTLEIMDALEQQFAARQAVRQDLLAENSAEIDSEQTLGEEMSDTDAHMHEMPQPPARRSLIARIRDRFAS